MAELLSLPVTVREPFIVEADAYLTARRIPVLTENSERERVDEITHELQHMQQEETLPEEIVSDSIEASPKPTLLKKVTAGIKRQAELGKYTTKFFFSRLYPKKSYWQTSRELGGSVARTAFFWTVPSLPIPVLGGLERSTAAMMLYMGMNPEVTKSYKTMAQFFASVSASLAVTAGSILLHQEFWEKVKKEGKSYKEIVEDVHDLQEKWSAPRLTRLQAGLELSMLQVKVKSLEGDEASQLKRFLEAIDKTQAKNPDVKKADIFLEVKQFQKLKEQQKDITESTKDPENEDLFYEIGETYPTIQLDDMYTLYLYAAKNKDNEATLFAIAEKFPHASVEQIAGIIKRIGRSKKAEQAFWEIFDKLPNDIAENEGEYLATIRRKLRKMKQVITANKVSDSLTKYMLNLYLIPSVIFASVAKAAIAFLPVSAAFMVASLSFTTSWRTKARLKTARTKAYEAYEKKRAKKEDSPEPEEATLAEEDILLAAG